MVHTAEFVIELTDDDMKYISTKTPLRGKINQNTLGLKSYEAITLNVLKGFRKANRKELLVAPEVYFTSVWRAYLFKRADSFFMDILNTRGTEKASAFRDVVEMFSNYLVSRGYIDTDLFGQPPTACILHHSSTSNMGNNTLDISRKLIRESENSLSIQTHITPKAEALHLTPRNNSSTPIANISPLIVAVKTPAALTKPLKQLFADFIHEKSYLGKKLRPSTLKDYSRSFDKCARFLKENNLTLTTEGLKNYVEYLEKCTTFVKEKGGTMVEKKLAPETKMVHKSSLLSFLNHAVKNDWLTIPDSYHEILQSSKRDRTPEKSHIALTLDEVEQLIYYASTLNSIQEILELLIPLLCGPRAYETVNITRRCFDIANSQLHLTVTKSGIPRDVALPDFMIKFMNQFLSNFALDDYIFPSRQAKMMQEKTLTEHIKKAAQKAGLNRAVTCHDLRSTFATLQYYHGEGDLIQLQGYMGHDDINTTANYVSSRRRHEQKNVIPLEDLYQKWENILLTRM